MSKITTDSPASNNGKLKINDKIFSVVIACYNCQDYLDETISSLLNQTLPFKDNIEVILVDDGSTDNTGKICQKYIEKYPENFIYLSQENQGQGTARNNGLKYATGKYINFLDSDDLFSKNAFKNVYEFIKKNPEVNFISIPIKIGSVSNFTRMLPFLKQNYSRNINLQRILFHQRMP